MYLVTELFNLPTDSDERLRLRRIIDGPKVRYELTILPPIGEPSSVELTVDELEQMLNALEMELGETLEPQSS